MTQLRHTCCRLPVGLIAIWLVGGLWMTCGSSRADDRLLQPLRVSPVEFQSGRFELGGIAPDFRGVSVAIPRPDSGFRKATDRWERRFLPRAESNLENLSVMQLTGLPGAEVQDQVMYGQMSEAVRQFAERATRKAVKHYVLESIEVERTIDEVKSKIRSPLHEEKKVRFDFGIHSAMPEVTLRYGLDDGRLRFRVSAEGKFNVQYQRFSMKQALFNLGYNGEGYEVGYVIAF